MKPIDIIFPNKDGQSVNSCPWGYLSQRLLEVQSNGSWLTSSRSFTAFIKELSIQLSIKESVLWRYLGAGDFYNNILRTQFNLTPLDMLAHKVSPENIELLGKLVRAVPSDEFSKLVQLVLSVEIKRDELRKIWNTYKPALLGKTSRGYGTVAPKVNVSDNLQVGIVQESAFRNMIFRDGLNWSGADKANCYRVFEDIKLPRDSAQQKNVSVDMVVVAKDLAANLTLVHGIEYISSMHTKVLPNLEIQEKYFDLMWLASSLNLLEFRHKIPDHIGIIISNDSGTSVLREARSSNMSGMYLLNTVKNLLLG